MSNNLTPNNTPTHVASLSSDGAVHFAAASSQSLTIASNSALQLPSTGDFTIGAWVKPDSLGVNRVLMAKDDDATNAGSEYWLGYEQSSGTFQFQVETTDNLEAYAQSLHFQPATGKWYFVVGWFERGVGSSIQVNNGEIDFRADTTTTTRQTATAFSIGSDAGVGSFMDGAIDSAFMFHRLLTADERTALFNAGTNTVDPNNGTLHTGATYSADVPAALSANVNSVNLNGTSGYVSAGASVPMGGNGLGGVTFSLWFKAAAFGGMVLGQSNSANAYVRILNSTTIRFQTTLTGSFKDFTVPAMSLGTWYQLRIDYAATVRVFINNVESSTGAQAEVADGIVVDQVGRYWDGLSGLFFSGKIADVRLFSRFIVSSADAAALAAGGNTQAIPTVWWKLNEGTGTAALDSVPMGNPLQYAQLGSALKVESLSTFVSWWDLGETSGTRLDAKTVAGGLVLGRRRRSVPMIIAPGSTSISVDVFWANDTGAAVTGKVAADFPACKWSGGANTADTTITLSDLAAITTAHPNDNTAGGVKEREGGWYRFDLPNNMFTAAGRKTLTFVEATDKHIIAPQIDVQYVQSDLRQTLGTTSAGTAGSVRADAVSGNVGGNVGGTISGVTPAAAGAAMTLTAGERNSIADALLDRTDGIETSLTFRQAQRLLTAVLAGKAADSGGVVSFKRADGTTTALTVTHDAAGTRSVVTIGTLS